MKKIILLFLMLFVLPTVYADTCDPKPQIDDMGMSATTIALTSDPWSNIIAVEVNWSLNGTTDCKNAMVYMNSDLENIFYTEEEYTSVLLGDNMITNMDMIFLPQAVPGDDYLQVFITCDNEGCNNSGDFGDSHMFLFKITPLKCTTHENCSRDQYCNTNTQQCLELNCEACDIIENNTCISTCNDSDPCTVDFCGTSGKCEHNITENCCQADADCNDNLFCTDDACIDNSCVLTNKTCEVTGPCEISTCVEPDGCRIYNKTDCDPNTAVQLPKKSATERIADLKGSPIPTDKNTLVIGIIVLLLIVKFVFLR